jgi:hypothetical protein
MEIIPEVEGNNTIIKFLKEDEGTPGVYLVQVQFDDSLSQNKLLNNNRNPYHL